MLTERAIFTRQGFEFVDSNVKVILTNITYTGNLLFQKEYVADPITKKRKKNRGELPQYLAENTHKPIISKEDFDVVQAEILRRKKLGVFGNKSIKTTCFTSKIKCGNCGKSYRRSGKRQRKNADEVYYIWICLTKSQKGNKFCDAKSIPEIHLKKVCAEVLGIEEFDENIFTEQIERIIAVGDATLEFQFYDGRTVSKTWKSTAKTDWWTAERRKAWGELHKHKDTNPNRKRASEFTGFIKCGKCGANYRSQKRKCVNGAEIRSW